MRRVILLLITALVVSAASAPGASAADKIRVVATIPDLKALAEEVGGKLVDVEALARGNQNAHELEIRPSLMLKLRRADILLENGLDLDTWAEVVVQGANNPNIARGAPGRVDVSRGIQVLEVPSTRVDRSMGDVHPLGNPHYSLDPGMAPIVTQNIVDAFARFAPDRRADFERNRQTFLSRLDEAMARWTQTMAPFKGSKVVVYHPQWIYLLTRFGLSQAATLEDRPGIPATPAHLTRIIRQMKEEQIKVIVVEPWNDMKLAGRVADEAGAKAIVLASMVGGVKGADSYIAAIDHNVNALAQALR
ncbi:MAG TPA: metal ABC transporter substrate-binding protein [Methylomirabilota bacterium]|nr:metal ABC transporter substrate-binding protein [Methylomirabilota bacterium]